jgi:hypothetical protein
MTIVIKGLRVPGEVNPNGFATGPGLPDPPLPLTARELDPAPPDPGPCPECGRARPNVLNTFATGSLGAAPVPAREQYDTAEVTDPETGEPVGDFPDVTVEQDRPAPTPNRITTED